MEIPLWWIVSIAGECLNLAIRTVQAVAGLVLSSKEAALTNYTAYLVLEIGSEPIYI